MGRFVGAVPRVIPAGVFDALLAAALSLGALVDVVHLGDSRVVLLGAVLGLVCTASVSARRPNPIVAAVLALCAAAGYELVTHDPRFTFEPFAVALTLYSVGRTELRGGPMSRRLVLVAAMPAFGAMARGAGQGTVSTFTSWALFGLLPYAVGTLVERRARNAFDLASQTEMLLGEQELRVRSSQVQERMHIARELHDTIAHCVAEMVIQAGAARMVLEGDPASARRALLCVASSGRRAAADLDQVIRTDAHRTWSASRLVDLLEEKRRAGVVVEWRGAPVAVTGPVDSTGFRVVQEALTNAARHAPGAPVSVRIRADERTVDIAIVNGPVSDPAQRPGGSGFGLIGMRERIAAVVGSLEVGPTAEGGYVVHATLPRQTPPESEPGRSRFALLLSRARPRSTTVAVPLVASVVLVVEALTSPHRVGPASLNAAVAAAMGAAAVLRRRWPVAFLMLVGILALTLEAGLTSRSYATLTGIYSVLVPTYAVGSWAPRRTAVLALSAWAGVVTLTGLVQQAPSGGLAGPLMAGALAAAFGMIARSQRELNQHLVAAYGTAQSESRRIERLAADRERARLAEQLHAPVAGIVALMSDCANEALDLLDAGLPGVGAVLTKVENDGREAMRHMRNLLGALRSEPPEAATRSTSTHSGQPVNGPHAVGMSA